MSAAVLQVKAQAQVKLQAHPVQQSHPVVQVQLDVGSKNAVETSRMPTAAS